MRKYILACTFLLSVFILPSLKASHVAGGEITYQYVGPGTAPNSEIYTISLVLYKDESGINLGNTANICITSSCFGSQNGVQLTRVTNPPGTVAGSGGGFIVPTLDECVNSNSAGYVTISQHIYQGNITLNGPCADWTFYYTTCCRNGAITNGPSNAGFVIMAELNNTLGPNSSPQFITPAAKAFCVGTPFVWSQASTEADGDSTIYQFGQPFSNASGCSSPVTFTTIPWAAGYTTTAPMTTVNGIQVDAQNGTFRFTPAQVEVDVIKVTITEYRFDNTFLQWLKIGEISRELQVPIVANCKASASNGPQIDLTQAGTGQATFSRDSLKGYGFANFDDNQIASVNPTTGDTTYNIPVIPYNCFDNTVDITFDIDVYCESISPDGTDFRITGPDTVPRPVTGVITNCQPDLTTRNIQLQLHKPLDVNGTYFLYIKAGNDGNTILNRCGFPLDTFFMIAINVTDCPNLDYELENVSVEDDKFIRIDWRADPSTYNPALFNEWNILRANNDNFFYPIGSLNNPSDHTLRTYLDTALDDYLVDFQVFQYAVQLVQNFSFKPPTNQIRSIVLGDSLENLDLRCHWTPYDGWSGPSYDLWRGVKETDTLSPIFGEIKWESSPLASGDSLFQSYIIDLPDEPDTNIIYALQISSHDPDAPNNNNYDTSWSNVVFYEIKFDPEVPVIIPDVPVVPTVFTPNGDAVNETFYMNVAPEFTNIEISVYNRWGTLVFQDSDYAPKNTITDGWNGTDINSGQKLADGVYYYTIRLFDPISDTEENLKGSLTILTGGSN